MNRFGMKSTLAMGITDVDDKIMNRAASTNTDPLEWARRFEDDFKDDMKLLGVQEPDVYLRVTEHIDEIVSFVSSIKDRGFAYEDNGSVWFDTSKFAATKPHTYGKLKGPGFDEAAICNGYRSICFCTSLLHLYKCLISVDNMGADKPRRTDFALWKAAKPGELSWDSPWGLGRPGWHIECSAMSTYYCVSTSFPMSITFRFVITGAPVQICVWQEP